MSVAPLLIIMFLFIAALYLVWRLLAGVFSNDATFVGCSYGEVMARASEKRKKMREDYLFNWTKAEYDRLVAAGENPDEYRVYKSYNYSNNTIWQTMKIENMPLYLREKMESSYRVNDNFGNFYKRYHKQ
jgi:hypothetical protein